MKIRNSLLVLSLAGAGLLVTATGCEDRAAADRAETQQQILDAARTLDELDAVGVDPDEPERYGEELRSLANQLGALMTAAEGGQREAVALLAANANRRLSEHLLSRITDLESRQRLDQARLHSAAKAVIVLDGLAASQRRIELRDGQQTLERQAATYREQRDEHESSLRELERPIEELRAVIEARQQEASRLRQREDDLLREAIDRGPADGFEQFQEAIELRRQANRLEIEIARREIQLHEYQLEREIVQKRRSAAEQTTEAIDASRERLLQYVNTMHDAGAETQRDVDAMRERAAEALRSIEQRMDGPLSELYAEAQQRIDEAASRIQQAGRDPAVQLAAARINQVRARVHSSRVHAMRSKAAVLESLAEVEQAFAEMNVSGRLDQARRAAEEAAEQAVAALTEARQTLSNLPDANQPRIARAIENIEAMINAMRREPAPQSEGRPGGEGRQDRRDSGGDASLGTGARSAEQLVEVMRQATAAEFGSFTDQYADLSELSAREREMLDLVVGLMNAMSDFEAAVAERFGEGAAQRVLNQGMMQFDLGDDTLLFEGAQLVDAGEAGGTVEYRSMETGERETAPLVERDGQWYVVLEPDAGPGMDDVDLDDPMAQMIVGMFEAMRDGLSELAGRVRGGEFESIEALEAEIAAQMAPEGMQGGGMPPGMQ